MFGAKFLTATLICALALKANAHAAIDPPLGVTGTPVRNDVQRPSTAKPCGNVDIASTLDTSTAVQADANGQFTVQVQNFNAGADGSTSVSGTVDDTATGNSFSGTVTITKNGNPKPTAVETDTVVASLPAGTKCTGGTSGDLCLVSFKTTAGFGNCVVVQQGSGSASTGATGASGAAASGASAATSTSTSDTTTSNNTTSSTTTSTSTGAKKGKGKAKKGKKGAKAKNGATKAGATAANAAQAQKATAKAQNTANAKAKRVLGSRAPRALRYEEWQNIH